MGGDMASGMLSSPVLCSLLLEGAVALAGGRQGPRCDSFCWSFLNSQSEPGAFSAQGLGCGLSPPRQGPPPVPPTARLHPPSAFYTAGSRPRLSQEIWPWASQQGQLGFWDSAEFVSAVPEEKGNRV